MFALRYTACELGSETAHPGMACWPLIQKVASNDWHIANKSPSQYRSLYDEMDRVQAYIWNVADIWGQSRCAQHSRHGAAWI
jgi:hypothetical protein